LSKRLWCQALLLRSGVCKDKNIANGNLENKIDTMCSDGVITHSQKDTLHQLRFLGNDAIHDLTAPKNKEIEAALDIIEHIINDIYEVPAKTEILKKTKQPED
jgi:uncharacterized lipoprotein YajG